MKAIPKDMDLFLSNANRVVEELHGTLFCSQIMYAFFAKNKEDRAGFAAHLSGMGRHQPINQNLQGYAAGKLAGTSVSNSRHI